MPDSKKIKKEWFIKGTLGTLFLGSGLCGMIESGFLKYKGIVWYEWALAGTISLCITMTGVIFLIQSGILSNELKKLKLASEQ